MQIQWHGQSGYILNDGKCEIAIDLYLSDIVEKVANRPRMKKALIKPKDLKSDVVICTHDHLDHLDTDAIFLMNKEDMLFLSPSSAKEKLLELGVKNHKTLDEKESLFVGDFEIIAVKAIHSVDAIGLVIRHNGITMYFSCDTEFSEELFEIKKYNADIMFVCINGKLGNMDVSDAVRFTKEIAPKVAIPSHYGMFESNTEDPKKFTDKIDNGFIMEYGKKYEIEEVLQECLI